MRTIAVGARKSVRLRAGYMKTLIIALSALVAAAGIGCSRDPGPFRYPPAVVVSPYRLPGVIVEGAGRGWWKVAAHPVRYGDPVPVGITMYCLQGTTRRGRYVRSGIVAADPRYFPLARYIELYVGKKYLGRFLVDDTGKRIQGARIDVWTNSCREARRFGIARGTAVLVHRSEPEVQLAGTARGAARHGATPYGATPRGTAAK